jgi:hypothetical protein
VIVVFSLAALDQKNVVWVGDTPCCPHCRAEVRPFSQICATCDHAFDWLSHERACSTCLTSLDAEYLRGKYSGNEEAYAQALRDAGVTEEQQPFFIEYVDGLKSGVCGFCGGSGNWEAAGFANGGDPEGENGPLTELLVEFMGGKCPVCLGTGRCAVCDGDHLVEHAREASSRDLYAVNERLDGIFPLRDKVSAETRFMLITSIVRRHRGRAEVSELPSFDQGQNGYTWRAQERLRFVTEILTSLP